MSQDIRRMTREDLDRLNVEAKAWREQRKLNPENKPHDPPENELPPPPGQLDLFAIDSAP